MIKNRQNKKLKKQTKNKQAQQKAENKAIKMLAKARTASSLTENKKHSPLKLTQDIVFKSFFSRNKTLLMAFLKNFLPISDEITDIVILNPEKIDEDNKSQQFSSHSSTNLHSRENGNPEDINSMKTDNTGKKTKLSKSLSKKQQISNQLELKETSLYSNRLNKKQIVLDLSVKLHTGENINVEMQTISQRFFLKRILFYWAKLYCQDLEKGESYSKINPAYSLIFTTFPILNKKITDFMSSFSIRRDKKPHQLFNEDLKIVVVELSKLTKACEELLDLKEKWCYFLKESGSLTKEEWSYLSQDEEMKMALKQFNKLSRDQRLYQEALSREKSLVAYNLDRQGLWNEGIQKGIQKGMQKGLKQGMIQGKLERNEEIALNMLEKGFKTSVISKVTGLSESKINTLRK